jgi:hypothetical protein
LQPKPHAASDYCYSDRLFPLVRDLFPQPMAFRFYLLRYNLPAVLFYPSCDGSFRDEVSFRLRCASPEGFDTSSGSVRTEVLISPGPCDSIAERTFPVFFDLTEHLVSDLGPVSFAQASALLICRPEGLNEPAFVSFK